MKKIYSGVSIIIIICLVISVLCSCDLITTDKDKFILKEINGDKFLKSIDLEKTGPDIVVPEKVGEDVIKDINLACTRYLKIESIDVSNVKELECFRLSLCGAVSTSKLKKLDFSKNKKLERVVVSDVKSLNEIIFNENCELISLHDNASIKEIDLRKLKKLSSLTYCDGSLEEIDVSKNSNLQDLWLKNTKVTELDLSNNPNLQYLDVLNTKVKELDVSNNPNLKSLTVLNTKVKAIDVSNNPKLEHIEVDEGMEIIGDTNAEIEYWSKEALERLKEN